MTESEPPTEFRPHQRQEVYSGILHKVDTDSDRGIKKKEEYFMPYEDIGTYLNAPPLKLVDHHKMSWRLNSIYVGQKGLTP